MPTRTLQNFCRFLLNFFIPFHGFENLFFVGVAFEASHCCLDSNLLESLGELSFSSDTKSTGLVWVEIFQVQF